MPGGIRSGQLHRTLQHVEAIGAVKAVPSTYPIILLLTRNLHSSAVRAIRLTFPSDGPQVFNASVLIRELVDDGNQVHGRGPPRRGPYVPER